jgi:hypothetical protein
MTMSSHVQTHVHAPAQLDNKKLDIYFPSIQRSKGGEGK